MGHVTTAINSIGESIAPVDTIISITALGHQVLRYGLALTVGWIGFIKFAHVLEQTQSEECVFVIFDGGTGSTCPSRLNIRTLVQVASIDTQGPKSNDTTGRAIARFVTGSRLHARK